METMQDVSVLAKLLWIGSSLNVMFFSMVVWLLRRLIVKVDKIDILEVQVKAMVHEMKDLGHLRERVAVIETLVFSTKRRKNNDHHSS